ncbi:MAG: glycine--tRNA ligase subunit beta [Thermoanaerobaculia bacterium]
MADEYLLEIRSQDMPPAFQQRTIRHLATRIFEELMGRGLGPEQISTGATPRRLVVSLKTLPDREPDREERELGPPAQEAFGEDGEPTEALAGFCERVGVTASELETVKTERGEYVAVLRSVQGLPLAEALAEVVPRALGEARWGTKAGVGDRFWVRPLRSFVSLLDGEVAAFEFGGLTAGRRTAGHPILSPESFEIADGEDYRRRLADLGIVVSLEERRQSLHRALQEQAEELGGELIDDPALLDRLVLLCEIPGVVSGSFRAEYLALPEEVLLATLNRQESAFAVRRRAVRRNGDLLPAFLTVMDRLDDPRGFVKSGQERAAAGRLSDARFYYEHDRDLPLAERGRSLDQLAFHPRLGSYADKTERLRALVELICGELGWEEAREPALEATGLLKADLTTDMVRELPELRGTIGGIYAREEGYVEGVWQAVYDHYRPASRDRPIPRHPAGRVVAIADRLDTLVGFLGIGPIPSASKDPFALRRLAQGLLQILIEAEIELDLDLVAARAVLLHGEALELPAEEVLERLQGLLGERVARFFGQRGFAHDEIDAAMAVGKKNLPQLAARVEALGKVRQSAEFGSLVLAARRIANIIRESPEFELDDELLVEEAEIALVTRLREVRALVDSAVEERRYEDGLRAMVELVPTLDRFFADVLVMDEDQSRRANRIALLQSCRRLFWRIARLNAVVVEKEETP